MVEINNTTRQVINLQRTAKLVEKFLRVYKKSGYAVSVALIGHKKMKRLNHKYRRINKTTDVLSFPARSDWPAKSKGNNLGEIIINLDEVKKIGKYKELFGKRKQAGYIFDFILVHGLLHLVGYNDSRAANRQEMLERGQRFLRLS